MSETTHSGDAKLQKFEDFYGYYKNLKIFMDITKIWRFLWILNAQILILDVNISIITDSNKNCKKKIGVFGLVQCTMNTWETDCRLLKVHKDKKEHIRDIELG